MSSKSQQQKQIKQICKTDNIKSESPKLSENNNTRNNIENNNFISKTESVEKKLPNENCITLAGVCAICWKNALYYCRQCQLVGYCCFSHMASHWCIHHQFCTVINNKVCQNKDYLYNSKINNADEWRFIRVKTLAKIKSELGRELEAYERDIILFPKYCNSCYQRDIKKLDICKKCLQVWHCRNDTNHLLKNHEHWCEKLQLFLNLVRKQAQGKLYFYDMNFGEINIDKLQFNLNDNIEKIIKNVLHISPELDVCDIAMISQAASGPLTLLYAINLLNYKVKKNFVIHLIGAELHFEGKTLQAWENFFIHFLPDLVNLKIIMIGPELNAELNYESIRLCNRCEIKKKTISFEYKDKLLYHQYSKSNTFCKPNIVCAFNPGFHRTTGFNQKDTWPQTIKSAVNNNCPTIFTAYTAFEAPLDLQRVQECALVHVIQNPRMNPFASLKPDRNFISDQEAPLIFKNYFLSIVTAVL